MYIVHTLTQYKQNVHIHAHAYISAHLSLSWHLQGKRFNPYFWWMLPHLTSFKTKHILLSSIWPDSFEFASFLGCRDFFSTKKISTRGATRIFWSVTDTWVFLKMYAVKNDRKNRFLQKNRFLRILLKITQVKMFPNIFDRVKKK